jgi:hypothetical protein
MASLFPRLVAALFAAMTVTADAPSTLPALPDVPALNSDDGRAFVVDGATRMTAADGFGFRFATDGARQLCVIFDAQDGTPLYLSDGQQTLVYDLGDNLIVRLPASRAYVVVDWNPEDARPLTFRSGVDISEVPETVAKTKTSFRVDRFVHASRDHLRAVDSGREAVLFVAQRPDGGVEAVQVPRGELNGFRFTSSRQGENFYRLELEARLAGGLPAGTTRFPDVARLQHDVQIVDFDEQRMPNFSALLKNGQASIEKMALAGGAEVQKSVDQALQKKGLPAANWDGLRQRDRKLGEVYRAALAKQGIRCRALATAPTTQATR